MNRGQQEREKRAKQREGGMEFEKTSPSDPLPIPIFLPTTPISSHHISPQILHNRLISRVSGRVKTSNTLPLSRRGRNKPHQAPTVYHHQPNSLPVPTSQRPPRAIMPPPTQHGRRFHSIHLPIPSLNHASLPERERERATEENSLCRRAFTLPSYSYHSHQKVAA